MSPRYFDHLLGRRRRERRRRKSAIETVARAPLRKAGDFLRLARKFLLLFDRIVLK